MGHGMTEINLRKLCLNNSVYESVEGLAKIAILDPSDDARDVARIELERLDLFKEVRLLEGLVLDGRILLRINLGKYPAMVYVCDLPDQYRGAEPKVRPFKEIVYS